MELEDNDQDESDVQEEEEQEGRDGIDEGDEDEVLDDDNEENEAESVGQDPQGMLLMVMGSVLNMFPRENHCCLRVI